MQKNTNQRPSIHVDYIQKLPDGGWGWVVVFAAFATNFVWGGLFNSYGVLYREFLNYFNEPRSYTSWIGSVLSGLGYACGILASGLINKFGIRPVALAGSLFAAVACFVSSFANNVMGLIILFGGCVGFGHALSYTATYIIVPYYFEKRRGLATGIAIAGSGVGNFVFAPLIRYLLNEYTWRGFMIIESGIIFQSCVFAALYRPVKLIKVPKYEMANDDEASPDDNGTLFRKESVLANTADDKFRARFSSDATDYRKYESKEAKKLGLAQKRNSVTKDTHSRKTSKIQTVALELLAQQERNRCHSVGILEENEWKKYMNQEDVTRFKMYLVDALKMGTSPFLRKDIFYASSLRRLPEYNNNENEYSQSILSLPKAIDSVVPETILEESEVSEGSLKISRNCCVHCIVAINELFGFYLLAKPEFLMYAFATFAFFFGYYVPTSVLYDYAMQLDYSKNQAIVMISSMGIANTIGRVTIGFISDLRCINRIILFTCVMVFMGLINESCWLFGYIGFTIIMTYAILFSVLVGAAKALLVVVAVDLMGIENLTNAYGLLLLFQGLGFLLGNPFAGRLYDASGGYALPFSILGGVLALSGFMIFLSSRIAKRK